MTLSFPVVLFLIYLGIGAVLSLSLYLTGYGEKRQSLAKFLGLFALTSSLADLVIILLWPLWAILHWWPKKSDESERHPRSQDRED